MRRALLVLLPILLAGCTGGADRASDDRDGDGLRDALETTPRAIAIHGPDGPVTRNVQSDPDRVDTDGDGLTDLDEFVRKTDPESLDTDGDGLLDGHGIDVAPTSGRASELRALRIHESPPGRFWGELDQCPAHGGLKPDMWSSDRPLPDKLGDVEEVLGWNVTVRGVTRHVASDPCVADTDRDGLADHDEKAAGTDPNLPDTDGDGTRDGRDADPLWNLTLRLDRIVATRTDGGEGVRLTLGTGALQRSLILDANATLDLDVPDDGARGTLPLQLVLSTTNPETGAALRLFEDPRGGAVVEVDLARDEGGDMTFEGADGTLVLRWSAQRV